MMSLPSPDVNDWRAKPINPGNEVREEIEKADSRDVNETTVSIWSDARLKTVSEAVSRPNEQYSRVKLTEADVS